MNRKQTVSTVLLSAALAAALALPAAAAGGSCIDAAAAVENRAGACCIRLSGLLQAENAPLSACVSLSDFSALPFCPALDGCAASDSAQSPDTEQTPADSEISEAESSAVTSDSGSAASAEQETAAVSAYEQEVVELVNEIRAEYGLSALTLSEQLCSGARLKSEDMRQNGYFSHESPTYGTPFAMMQSLGISYSVAAENIAMGQSTPQEVVSAWMNSEGHRANILSESFTQIGVGYVADGNYWTQWFVG